MAGPAVLKIDIVTNARGSTAAIAETDSKLGRLGSTASKAGALLATGLAGAGIAAVALGKQAYDAASNVQQAFGAVDSVFGKSAAQVKAWANSAATDVGLAKSQYADLAALLGSQLTNMGRSSREAAGETNNLIKLGADLAATYGGSVADAVSAVSSVLKGETDPIERYGISIKQSDISARLAAEGLDKLEGSALKQATATAALALVTEQSTKAQGAFGREADTAAGQQARLAANVENLKARVGQGLLPVMTAAFEFINTRAIPYASQLGETFSRDVAPRIAQVADFVQTRLIPAARAIVTWFVEKIVPNIRAAVVPILTQLRASFGGVADTLDRNSGNLQKLARFIGDVIEVISKLAPIVGKVIVANMKVMSATIEAVITTISTLVGWVQSAIDKIEALGNAIKNNPISKGIGKGIGAVTSLFGGVPLAGQVGRLVERSGPTALGPGGLATAALSPGAALAGGYRFGASTGTAIVDARTFYRIDASGAVDPLATADRLADVLRKNDVRKGRAPSFSPATGWAG